MAAVTVAVVATALALAGAGYEALRSLPIQAGGRIKPFDTYATESTWFHSCTRCKGA